MLGKIGEDSRILSMKTSISRHIASLALPLIVFVPTQVRAIDLYFDSPDRRNTVVVHAGVKETVVAYKSHDKDKTNGPHEVEMLTLKTDATYPFPRLMWSPDGRYLAMTYSYRKAETLMLYEFPENGDGKQLDTGEIYDACEDIGKRLVAAGKRDGKPWADGRVDFSGYEYSWPPKEGRMKVTLSGEDDESQEFSVAMDFDVRACKVSNLVITINGKAETLPTTKKAAKGGSK